MKNEAAAAYELEEWFWIASQWEEEPEIDDPWQRNVD